MGTAIVVVENLDSINMIQSTEYFGWNHGKLVVLSFNWRIAIPQTVEESHFLVAG